VANYKESKGREKEELKAEQAKRRAKAKIVRKERSKSMRGRQINA
jgi:hypothetical protein